MSANIIIRKSTEKDEDGIWEVLQPIIRGGDVFAFDPKSTRDEIIRYWCAPGNYVYVALENDRILGTFFLRNNQPGLGSHVANAGYAVSPSAMGKGIGKLMAEFSLVEARNLGYLAMQYNIVIKSNEGAVALWKKMGFEIIGEIPDAFRHSTNGMTNAYIMYRKL